MKCVRKFCIILLFLSFLAHPASAEEILTWQDCVREAAKNHPDLISAQEKINQSVASKEISKSGLLPQVTADLGVSTEKASTKTKTTNTYDYDVSATQLLFDAFKTADDVKSAAENIKASQEAFRYSSCEIRLRLRTAFIELLKAQEMLKVAQDIFEIRRSNLELITLRYESGLEHKGALLTAEADVAEAKLDIDKAKRDLEVTQRQLTKEMGRSKFLPLRLEGNFKVKKELEKPDFETIAKNNPSLKEVVFQKNAARYGIKSAYANFFPEISGDASIGKTASRWPPRKEKWDTGLTLSWPIFEGGLKTAKVKQAESLFKQYEADERSTKDAIIFNLEETWAALEDSIDTISVQKKFLEASEERARIAEAQYSLGLIKFDNWTIIQDDLVTAKKSLLDAQANALLAEANWIQAKGETLEYVE